MEEETEEKLAIGVVVGELVAEVDAVPGIILESDVCAAMLEL